MNENGSQQTEKVCCDLFLFVEIRIITGIYPEGMLYFFNEDEFPFAEYCKGV